MGEARRRQTAERQPQYCDLTTGELRPARDGGDPEVYLDSMVQGQQPPVPCNGCTTCCYHTRVDVYLDQERPEDLPHLDTETFFGEKTSLEDVLGPLAIEFNADLYLTGGQISDTLLHRMARDAVGDGRPLSVFTFSDFDPAGYWDMPTCHRAQAAGAARSLVPDARIHRRPRGARSRTGARSRPAVVAAEGGRKARRQMARALRLGADRNRRAGDPAARRAGADRPRGGRALFRRQLRRNASGTPKPIGRRRSAPRSPARSTRTASTASRPAPKPRSTQLREVNAELAEMADEVEVSEPPTCPRPTWTRSQEAQEAPHRC